MLLLLALTLAAVAGLFGGADHLLPGLEGGVLCDGVIVAYGLGVDVGLRRLSTNLPAQLTVLLTFLFRWRGSDIAVVFSPHASVPILH